MNNQGFDHHGSTHMPRVGVAALVVRENKVLMIQRKHSHGAGNWSTPGGHLDWGEDPGKGAVRELLEETGVVMESPRLVAVTNDVFRDEGKHYVTLWMQGEWVSGDGVIVSADEVDKIGWFAWDELPTPHFLPLHNLVNHQSYPPDAIGKIVYESQMLHIFRKEEACLLKNKKDC